MRRVAFNILEIENAAVLCVPTVFDGAQQNISCFFHQIAVVVAFGQIHHEPHGFVGVSRIHCSALETFQNIKDRSANPKGIYNKLYPGTRPMKSFSLPMIMCNLSLILEEITGKNAIDKIVKPLITEVMEVFYQKDTGLILESVAPDGSFCDCFEGRTVNPGHTNEAMWFMMDLAERYNDRELMKKSIDILLRSIDYGWDTQYGGIFYFMDIKGYPPQQLEWDQKLWWVHIETLIALLKGYRLTGDIRCKDWFLKIQDYTWEHFRDNEFPEWYGYLTRQGTPLLTLKGGKWKGCFHVPRGLFQIWKIFNDVENHNL